MSAQEREQKVTPRFWNPIEKAWLPVRSPSGERIERPEWPLVVDSVESQGGHSRRVRFRSDALRGLNHEPGSDVTLQIPDGGETARRHYTARSFDAAAGLLDIDFALHGEGPAVRWARAVQPGAEIRATGPVARFDIDPTASWYLFAGDDSAVPAIFGLLESLPAGAKATAFIEVIDAGDELPVSSQADLSLSWLHRGEAPGEASELLQKAVFAQPLPPGRGQVFLAGETGCMRELRKALLEAGLEKEQIFAMGYWRPGRLGGDETIRD